MMAEKRPEDVGLDLAERFMQHRDPGQLAYEVATALRAERSAALEKLAQWVEAQAEPASGNTTADIIRRETCQELAAECRKLKEQPT